MTNIKKDKYGYGLAPLGFFPFGTYSPSEVVEKTNVISSARYLDINNKDFSSSNENGDLDSMPNVRQRVILALTTVKGSSTTMQDFGNDVLSIKKIDQNFESLLKNAVRRALNQLSEIEKIIKVEDIIIDQKSTFNTSYTVIYNDLTTNKLDNIRITK